MARYPMRLTALAVVAVVAIFTLPASQAGALGVSRHQHGVIRSLAAAGDTPDVKLAAQSGNTIVPGFSTYTLPANDDGSTSAVSLPFPIDFYGTTYSSLYVNNNGNFTMGQPFGDYTPQSLNQLGVPMIAPFWADVDTRTGPVVTYGYGTVGGHMAFGANWLGVGCFSQNSSVANYFQVLLISRPDVGYGDFDIEFNYGPITWDSGQASSGNGQCLGGIAARVGYTSGFGTSYELPGSGVDGGLLSSNPVTGLSSHGVSSSQPGRYVFAVRGAGQPQGPSGFALGNA